MDNDHRRHIARGRFQRSMLDRLLQGETVKPLDFVKNPKKGTPGIYNSLERMFERLTHMGYAIWVTPGPRGGKYGSRYRLARKIEGVV